MLLGARVRNLIHELRDLSAVNGQLVLGNRRFAISRPLVDTETAIVEIAEIGGKEEALRLPARRPSPGFPETYRDWLLRVLELPRLSVPRAPTQPDSEATPVTISDYMNYCFLTQDEIDGAVLGHHDPFRNIKRRYVFQIVYGMYDVEAAQIQERLREATQRLRAITADEAALQQLLEDTPWENRVELEIQLDQLTTAIESNLTSSSSIAHQAGDSSPLVAEKRDAVVELDRRIADIKTKTEKERIAIDNLKRLSDELYAQSARLTRAIVADTTLVDFEFIVCPRCNSTLPDREDGVCRLCLQEPNESVQRDSLVAEQELISDQIAETEELIARSRDSINRMEGELRDLVKDRAAVSKELDAAASSFVSQSASQIANVAAERAMLTERQRRLQDYLQLFDKAEERKEEASQLRSEIDDLEAQLGEARSVSADVLQRVETLEHNFDELLNRFNVPEFAESQGGGRIDRQSFLPTVGGRRFDELSSQGLKVLVNVAHALAHQLTAIELGLSLPNLLIIDGLTSNLGHEGEDRDRVLGVYEVLEEISDEYGETLQLVVADNDVPQEGKSYETLTLGRDNLLIK